MTGPRHLVLDVPLAGVQLIEASAGTGKTYALALLVTRLVIERGLGIEQILLVTFTRAATQELREKLRRKLRRACELTTVDMDVDVALSCELDDEDKLLLALIRAAASSRSQTLARIRQRLQRAVLDIDLAAVFTIDGFCLRVLTDDALAAGQPLQPAELLGSEKNLHDEVALEAWRHVCQSDTKAILLPTLWKSPTVLARQLPDLLRTDMLLPSLTTLAMAGTADDCAGAKAAAAIIEQGLRAACARHLDDATTALENARVNKWLNGNKYSANTIGKSWAQLQALLDAPPLSFLDIDQFKRLATSELEKGTNRPHIGKTPASPLFDAIAAWCDAVRALQQQQEIERLQLLHEVRDYTRERLAHWKRLRHQQGFGDLIASLGAALAGADGGILTKALRDRYPVALVDEFQDTDPKQWAIFERLYVGQETLGLFLVGDPKQAIYGFRGGDVHAYLQARGSAQGIFTLDQNFRSRPRVLSAIAEVFHAGGDDAFAEPGIVFTDVQPGGKVFDRDFNIHGVDAAGLTLWALPNGGDEPIRAERARALATQACVQRIRDLLAQGRTGEALLTLDESGQRITRGVLPRDIAVLVSNHKQATRMQLALADAGIASVTAGKQSLFDTDEAREILWLLEAVGAPDDDRRLRTVLATVLIGEDAAAIAALSTDDSRQRHWLDALQSWRERWDRHGPLPMIADRVAAAGPRLLALADGERRLGNYLQLAEVLQEAGAAALGPTGLRHWLGKRMADADADDDTQQLRLESDARRVQIMTVHKSKGLEFPLVFLPFAALPAYAGDKSLLRYHDGEQRVTHARSSLVSDAEALAIAENTFGQQQRAEQLRLLYVGLTRAQHALWLAWGPANGAHDTALAWLLHRGEDGLAKQLDAATVDAALATLVARAPGAIVHEAFPDPSAPVSRLPPETSALASPLQAITRELSRDWWVYSYSQLSREETGSDQRGAEDETRPPLSPVDARYTGARFGNALHKALETVAVARWRDSGEAWPVEDEAALLAALRGEGYGDYDLGDGLPLLAQLVRQTLTTRLPEGVRLCDLPGPARRNEMEFHFAMPPTRLPELLALLHAHGHLRERQGFGARQRIEGLMTGKIDLVYETGGRVYLLDYKSNQLPDYEPATLAAAMRESEYDLQYLLYALALHRWLRFRLGASYDYDRHFGGVRYLFCRGLDARRDDGAGIYASKPARALIEALDALLAPPRDVAA